MMSEESKEAFSPKDINFAESSRTRQKQQLLLSARDSEQRENLAAQIVSPTRSG